MPTQIKKWIIIAGDITLLYFSVLVTVWLRYWGSAGFNDLLTHIKDFTPLILVWLIIFYIHNLYEINSAKNTLEFYTIVSRALIINFFTAVIFFYFTPDVTIAPKINLFIYFFIFSALFILWRGQINSILKKRLSIKTAIIADSSEGARLALRLNQNPQIGYKVDFLLGHKISSNFLSEKASLPTILNFSKTFNLADLIREHNLGALIIEDKFLTKESFISSLASFIDDIEIINLTRFNERVWRKVDLSQLDHLWFLNNFASSRRIFYENTKRLFDFILSLILLPLALMVCIFISAIIKIEGHGPIFYVQTRVGQKGCLFKLIKFRTMRLNAESCGAQWTKENDARITIFGRLLRKIRLDELPQLINIIKGEMSFVGPRAERPEFHQMLVKDIPFYERRYLIRPGLTGWAQINYTYGSSVEDTKEKLSYDFYYLKNRSLVFDMGIILKTINIVLSALGR